MKSKLAGVLPAVASPCNENDVFLEDRFAELITSLCKESIDGLYVCGVTGDAYRLTLDERRRAAEIAVELSGENKNTVIVHIGATNTRDAVCLAGHATEIGATAISSIPPFNCNQKELVSYYKDISRASELPLLVYHCPGLTHYTMTKDEALELLDIDGVVGLKMTDWNQFFMKQLLLARPDIVVFSGYDEIFLPGLLYGAHGGIGTWYNLFPKVFIGIYSAVRAGNISRALEIQNRLLSFLDLATECGVRPLFEHLMAKRGFGPYCWRSPREILDNKMLERIEEDLSARIDDLSFV